MRPQTKSALLWTWLFLAPIFTVTGGFITILARLRANPHVMYHVGRSEHLWLIFLALICWSALAPVVALGKHSRASRWVLWLLALLWVLPSGVLLTYMAV